MYWPYLRTKENELLAVRELAGSPLGKLVAPIYKPTSATASTRNRLIAIAAAGVRFAVIVNPDEGKPIPTSVDVRAMLAAILAVHPTQAFPAIEVLPTTSLAELSAFTVRYAAYQCVIVHRDHILPASKLNAALSGLGVPAVQVFLDGGTPTSLRGGVVTGGNVLLRDGFQRHTPNGNYPPVTNFDDLLYTYASGGMSGFGDFGPLGDIYVTGGAAPSHVALHLTQPANGPTLTCRHFVSTSPIATDVRTKYLNALAQLCAFTGAPPAGAFTTTGVADFHTSHAAAHYPGLGLPKRWSLKHHIELVERHLVANGVAPFV